MIAFHGVPATPADALAECFAQPTTASKLTRFCDAAWHEAETGSPILEGALAYFDCRLLERHDGGDHTIFIGEIVAAGYREDAERLMPQLRHVWSAYLRGQIILSLVIFLTELTSKNPEQMPSRLIYLNRWPEDLQPIIDVCVAN